MNLLTLDEYETLKASYFAPSGRGIKVQCPVCPGRNFFVTEDNGLCYCFNCGASYRLEGSGSTYRPFVESPNVGAIREIYTELAGYYHSQLRQQDRDELHARGLNDDTIEELRIGYCPPFYHELYENDLAYEGGIAYRDHKTNSYMPFLADRIIFPYIVEGLVTDLRGRSSTADVKYLSTFRSPRQIGADYPYNWQDAKQDLFILTEGEIKAASAHQAGFRCVALPGMTNWKEKLLPDPKKRVIILFDRVADQRQKLATNKAILRIANKVPDAYIGSLPLLGERKMDIDAFLVHPQGGKAAFEDVINTALHVDEWKPTQRF